MDSAPSIASKSSLKPGYFSIYKKGQGKWVRWGTVAAMALAIAIGVVWLVQEPYLALTEAPVKVGAAAVWVLFWAWVAFCLVNSPKMAEFLIATESEMRKVSWPSRREVSNSTKVVILLTAILGILLFAVDIGFLNLFKWMGIA